MSFWLGTDPTRDSRHHTAWWVLAALCLAPLVGCEPRPDEDTVEPPAAVVPSDTPELGGLVQGLTAANESLRAEIDALQQQLDEALSGGAPSAAPGAPPQTAPVVDPELRRELAAANRELATLRVAQRQAEESATNLNREIETLRASEARLEATVSELRAARDADASAQRSAAGDLSAQLEAVQGASEATRTALEGRVESLLVASIDRSRELESALMNEARLSTNLVRANARIALLETSLQETGEQQQASLERAQDELLADLGEMRREFEARLARADGNAEELRTLLANAETEAETLREQLAANEATRTAASESAQALEAELERARAELAAANQRSVELDQIRAERDTLAEKISTLEAATADLRGELESSRRQITTLQADTTDRDALDAMETRAGELERTNATLLEERDRLATELQATEASRRKALYELEKQTQQSSEILASLTEANTRIEGLVTERGELSSRLETEQNARVVAEKQAAEGRTAASRLTSGLEDDLTAATRERDSLRTELGDLRERLAEVVAETQAGRDQVARRDEEIRTLRATQSETVEARDGLREALEKSGAELEEARENLAALRKNITERTERVAELERTGSAAQTRAEQLEAELARVRTELDALEERSSGSIRLLSKELAVAQQLSLDQGAELTALKERFDRSRSTAEADLSSLREKHEELDEKATLLETAGVELLGQLEERDRSIARLRQSAEGTESELRASLVEVETELAQTAERRDALARELGEIRTSLAEAEQSGTTTQRALSVAERRADELEKTLATRTAELANLRESSTEAAARSREQIAALERASSEKIDTLEQTSSERIAALESAAADDSNRLRTQATERDALAQKLRESEGQAAQRAEQISELEERLRDLTAQEEASRREVASLTTELAKTTQTLAERTADTQRGASTIESLETRVAALAEDLSDQGEANRKLAAEGVDLRRQLTELESSRSALQVRARELERETADFEDRIAVLESSLEESREGLQATRSEDAAKAAQIARLEGIADDLERQLLNSREETRRLAESRAAPTAPIQPAAVATTGPEGTEPATTTPESGTDEPTPLEPNEADEPPASEAAPPPRRVRQIPLNRPDPATELGSLGDRERPIVAEIGRVVPPTPPPSTGPGPRPTAPTTPSPAPSATIPTETVRAVRAAVQRWVDAWSAQDVDGYLAAYTGTFRPADGTDRASWAATRRQRLTGPEFIRVTVRDLVFTAGDARSATVAFEQNYRSNTFEDTVLKELRLVFQGERWRIASEQVLEPR